MAKKRYKLAKPYPINGIMAKIGTEVKDAYIVHVLLRRSDEGYLEEIKSNKKNPPVEPVDTGEE